MGKGIFEVLAEHDRAALRDKQKNKMQFKYNNQYIIIDLSKERNDVYIIFDPTENKVFTTIVDENFEESDTCLLQQINNERSFKP